MGALGKILCILVLILHKSSQQPQAFNDQQTLSLPVNYNIGWMAALDDETFISKITIPGTHESLALHGISPAVCQSWSLENQLKAGIRYFDFRVSGKNLEIMHGWIYQKTTFPEALNTIKTFLSQYTTETVLVRVKPVFFGPDKVPHLVEEVIKKEFPESWVAENIPKMSEVRGKVVFVQKNNFKLGVPLIETDKKGDYKIKKIEEKKAKIIAHLNEALAANKNSAVVLSYSSGTGWFIGPKCTLCSPKDVAKKINPWLYENLNARNNNNNPKLCFGVIAMDFPGFDLIQKVIEFNK